MKTMPKWKLSNITVVIAGLVAVLAIINQALAQVSSASQKETPRGTINFKNVTFSQAFPIYTNLCNSINVNVVADESVKNLSKLVTIQTAHPVTKSELIQLLETAFEKQAGVEVIHPTTNQVILRLQ